MNWLDTYCYLCVYYYRYCRFSHGPYDCCSDFELDDKQFPEVDLEEESNS